MAGQVLLEPAEQRLQRGPAGRRLYAAAGLAVPAFGFTTASVLGVLGDAWLIVSIVLWAAVTIVMIVRPGSTTGV
ncbi:hypothetical protein [Actinomadura montaniterrae]|uniref:hypothetical protein n=1 Tax=Actinomadura montaniterrae TaxID=1803903 RepID=UPI001CEF960E|nr:hypothetical protein [Actinomadura montaniterrae]